jgi:hypothetical protein
VFAIEVNFVRNFHLMKAKKFYLIAGLWILASRLFAQSFQPADLIGVWQYGPDISTAKITFMKDSILLMNSQDEKNKLIHYSVEKTDSGDILKMRPMDADSADLMYFKIKKIDQDLIHLGIFKMQVLNQSSGEWEERPSPPETMMVLRRRKDDYLLKEKR